MIAGHAPLAFALAASLAVRLGVDRRRAVAVGLLAGAFAVVPDVDMAYAMVGLLGSGAAGLGDAVSAFWGHSKVVHRAITHSLVLAVPAAAVFALAAGRGRSRAVAAAAVSGALAVAALAAGPLVAAMATLYAVAGLAVAVGVSRYGFGPRAVLGAALVGLVSHPFGDLFTGTPPRLLYPLDARIVAERVALLPDPTLNLLAVFGLELASVWLAVAVAGHLLDADVHGRIHWPAVAGAGYGMAALVLPAPTLEASYQFVFGALAVGSVGAVSLAGRVDRPGIVQASITGLAAVTLAGLAYAVVYALA